MRLGAILISVGDRVMSKEIIRNLSNIIELLDKYCMCTVYPVNLTGILVVSTAVHRKPRKKNAMFFSYNPTAVAVRVGLKLGGGSGNSIFQ